MLRMVCLRSSWGKWQATFAALRLSRTLLRPRLRDKPGGLEVNYLDLTEQLNVVCIWSEANSCVRA